MKSDVLRSFATAGTYAPGVNYPGFPGEIAADTEILETRGAVHFSLLPGDLAQLKPDCASRPITSTTSPRPSNLPPNASTIPGNRRLNSA